MSRTELSELGEFGLIDKLTSDLKLRTDSTVYGVGDDAAVIEAGNESILVSTDMMVEGIHFDLAYMPLKHLGYKAVTTNISDICAMNGVCHQVTVSIALSNRFSLEAVEELYKGVNKACEAYNVDLVGGDTTSSPSGLVISVTAVGRAPKDKVVYRKGASENELIVVSGDLGGAYMGLQVLEREKAVFEQTGSQPVLEGCDYLLERQLKPEARMDIIELLDEVGVVPTSMIDLSDGMASDIHHLCNASDLGCRIYDEKLPIDPMTHKIAREFEMVPTTAAMNGGEDYELMFTIKQSDFDRIKASALLSVVGHMTDKQSGLGLVDANGGLTPIEAQGWDHFKK